MSWMHRLRRGLRAFLRRETFERDMDEEMRIHVEMEAEEMSGSAASCRRRRGGGH